MADYFCESCGDTGTEGTECEHCDQMIVCRDCGGESAIQARKTETDTLRAKLDAAEKELATAWERAGLHLTMISNLQAGLKAWVVAHLVPRTFLLSHEHFMRVGMLVVSRLHIT